VIKVSGKTGMNEIPREILAKLASNQDINAGYITKLVNAGYITDLANAGYITELANAGYITKLANAGYFTKLVDVPVIDKPYTRIVSDIKEGRRIHRQSTFGPDRDPSTNLCKTPMCTAGHIVNLAGPEGYALKEKYGWSAAAAILFEKAHPGWPQQNYGNIPQEWAMAFLETMAEREASEP